MDSGRGSKKGAHIGPIAIIPDLDTLLAAHRVYLHTLFIPIAIVATSFLYKLKEGSHNDLIFLASLCYLSHLLLDFYPGPVATLWPITSVGYRLDVSVKVNQKSVIPTIQPHLAFTVKQFQVPNIVTDAVAVTPQSVVTAILLIITIILTQHKNVLRICK